MWRYARDPRVHRGGLRGQGGPVRSAAALDPPLDHQRCAAWHPPTTTACADDRARAASRSQLSIRARVANVYNRPESDFPTRDEYNDYLEAAEDLIFELISDDQEVAKAAERRLREYQTDNREAIAIYAAQRAEEERGERDALRAEEEARRAREGGASDVSMMHTPAAAREGALLAGMPTSHSGGSGPGPRSEQGTDGGGGRSRPMLYTPAMAANPLAPLVQPTPVQDGVNNGGMISRWEDLHGPRKEAAVRASGWSYALVEQRARDELLGLLMV